MSRCIWSAVILFVGLAVAVGYLGFRKMQQLQESIEDPVARSEALDRLLGRAAAGESLDRFPFRCVVRPHPSDRTGLFGGERQRLEANAPEEGR